MSLYVFGIKIILDDKASPIAANSDIGLYNMSSDNSEFRWIQNDVTGVYGWKSGIIIEGGLDKYTRSIDLLRSGNTADPGSAQVSIKNTNQFFSLIGSLVSLPGLRFQVWLFTDSTPSLQWYGVCLNPTWDSRVYTIPAQGIHQNRISNILTQINSTVALNVSNDTTGQIIPASFGDLFIGVDTATNNLKKTWLAKFQRVNDLVDESVYDNTYFTGSGDYRQFPIVDITQAASNIYGFKTDGNTTFTSPIVDPIGAYVKICTGTGSNQIRKVILFTADNITHDLIYFTVSDYFENELSDLESGEGISWIQFLKINRDYYSDMWPCKSFVDSTVSFSDTLIPAIFTYDSTLNLPNKISDSSCNIVEGEENNYLSIDPKSLETDFDTVDGYTLAPIVSPIFFNDSDLSKWSFPANTFDGYRKEFSGVYSYLGGNGSDFADRIVSEDTDVSGISTVNDKNYTSHSNTTLGFKYKYLVKKIYFKKVITFNLPKLDPNFSFDTCYLGIRSTNSNLNHDSGAWQVEKQLKILLRKWYKGVTCPIDYSIKNAINWAHSFDDIPDYYYTANIPSTGDKNFYQASNFTTYTMLSGYSNFDLKINSVDEYNSIIEGCVMIEVSYPIEDISETQYDYSEIYELCVIFKKSSSIKSGIFSFLKGRILNDTWGRGKTAASMIQKPRDLLEHICRLQNGNENDTEPSDTWGKAYWQDAPIKTSGDGSFDDTASSELVETDSLLPTAQITEFDSGYTDKIKKSICVDFVLANWIDKNGNECVKAVGGYDGDITDTITLADILDRSKIIVTELTVQDIYCEPFVQYDKNSATGNYESIISVTNSSALTYSSTFVSGNLTDGEKESLWTACSSLYRTYRLINKPPSDLTDMIWANGSQSDAIAKRYIQYWVSRMLLTCEIEFTVHLSKAGQWEECHKFYLNLPHHTNGQDNECIVESITINPNSPYDVTIKALMFNSNLIIERGSPLNDNKIITERGTPLNDSSIITER